MDLPLRSLWLAERCTDRRSQMPNVPHDDEAIRAIDEEHRTARKCKLRLERCLRETKGVQQQLMRAREAIKKKIQVESQGLDLQPETYSGSVLDYEPPRGPPPPQVHKLEQLCVESKSLRDRNTVAVEETTRQVKEAAQRAESSLQIAITDAKEVEVR